MKNLKIYFTSDMHGFVYPTDYRDNEKKPLGMLNIINSFEKDENTLIIDGGDTIQGSPFTTFLSKEDFEVHPVGQVMNEGGYDFVTLGNHDLNYGYEYLQKYLKTLNATCLCCNIEDKQNKLPIIPHTIKTLGNGLKVGIIGVTTDFITIWEKPQNLANINVKDTYTSLKASYEQLKRNVDILIGVYHGGFEKDLDTNNSLSNTKENLASKMCEELEFDILLTGHQHMQISNHTHHGTHIVQTPHNGQMFIELNLTYEDGIKEITSTLKTPEVKPNMKMYNELLPIEEKVQKWLDAPVGHLDTELIPSSHIDMALNGSYLANFINQIQLEASNADVASTSFANSIKGFSKDVTVRDIVSTYIFPNTLFILEVTGEILKKGLLRSAEYFSYDGNEVKISDAFLKPKVEHYNYDYFANIEYAIKLNQKGKNTIEYVKLNGKDIEDTKTYSFVTNNYRASGTGGYEFYKDCKVLREIQTEMPEIIINYFREHSNVIVDKTQYIKIIK